MKSIEELVGVGYDETKLMTAIIEQDDFEPICTTCGEAKGECQSTCIPVYEMNDVPVNERGT